MGFGGTKDIYAWEIYKKTHSWWKGDDSLNLKK